jgi:hypothetical protein
MPGLEIEGRIVSKLAVQSGTSAKGEWARQDFVLEYKDGNFPGNVCFSVWGQDKVNELEKYKVGDIVTVSFNIRGREYNGRWYNDLRAWRISPLSQEEGQNGNHTESYPTENAGPATSDPGATDIPPDNSDDDLPF